MEPDRKTIAEMFDTVSLGAPENAVGFVMWRLTHRFQRGVEQGLKHLDLTHLQFTILALVAWMEREGTRATQAELSRFGDVHPMQVSNVLKALDAKGMVRRTPDAGNALAKRVAVTTKGLETLRAAFPITKQVQHALFGEEGRPGGTLLETLLRLDKEGSIGTADDHSIADGLSSIVSPSTRR